MSIKNLRKATGMSQQEFARHFNISLRTLQQWEQERSSPPVYLEDLLKRILVLEREKIIYENNAKIVEN